jgi:hypothetical protein
VLCVLMSCPLLGVTVRPILRRARSGARRPDATPDGTSVRTAAAQGDVVAGSAGVPARTP